MRLTLLLPVLLLALCPQARGGLLISFTSDGSPGIFDVATGDTITIPVFVMQTDATAVLTADGLVSAGVRIDYDRNATSATVTAANMSSSFPDLRTETFDNANGFAILQGGTLGPAVRPPSGSNSILIGTLSFRGSSPLDVTMLTSSDPSAQTTFVSGMGADLDASVFASATSARINTTQAVPEPTTLALVLLCLAAWTCLYARHRHRRT